MFAQLPKEVQDEIKRHLMANEFIRAKLLYDAWVTAHSKEAELLTMDLDLAAAAA